MKFSTAFFALVPLVAALPPALRSMSDPVLAPRIQGNIFVCTAADFQGSCAVFHGASGECVNFSNAFNDDISAIGPDSDQDCFFWNDFGCNGEQLGPIRNPGITNLNQAGLTDFNDALSSFKCFFG